MRRFEVVGLVLVIVFALSAVMASGAQAGQIGKCVKAAKSGRLYTGKYVDKYCKTHATGEEETAGRKNKYEWVASTVAIPFTSEGAASRFKGGAGEFSCERLADAGTYDVGGVENKDTFTFTGCKAKPFEQLCTSYGAAAGEIKTYELASRFIDHGEKGLSGKEPAEGEVWEQETAAGMSTDPVFGVGPWLASYECFGIPFALSGSLSGVVEAQYVNVKLKAGKVGKETARGHRFGKPTFKIAFTDEGGEQDLNGTFVNPLNENEVETAPFILEGVDEVIISPLEKGLEVSGAV